MLLSEWKQVKADEFRLQVKQQMREGVEVSEHFLFSADELEIIKEEVEIEDFAEIVEDFEEICLDEDEMLIESVEVQESFDFIPKFDGTVMDIEIEVNSDYVSEHSLEAIKDLFFAESYEVEQIEESHRAKIIFKRSKGEVVKKKKCAKGMRLVGNKCLPQTGTQKAGERRRGIKLKRAFRAMGKGKKKKAQIKRKITDRRVRGRARNLANTIN